MPNQASGDFCAWADLTQGRSAAAVALQGVCSLLIVLVSANSSLAKTHPVPLEPNTDAAKCITCHEDKTKGKAVHSAIATGCLSCHELRVTKEVTRIKLTAVTPVKLCLGCHADKDASQIKGHVHSPAVRDCLKCHDPHVSDNKNQLLKATDAATKDANLCLQCHTQGLNVPAKGSRHAALDGGCETCHVTHKTGASAADEFRYHLTKAAPALCTECHDPKDAQITKDHLGINIEKADCLSCHDPHQSAAPKLMRSFQHNPFESKSCDTCHQPAKDGKVVLTAATVKALCVTCHDDPKYRGTLDVAQQHPGAQGDCTDCHSPHAGKTPSFVRPDPVNACLGCHTEQAELQKKGHLHQPAFEQGCATCHEPHGENNPNLLRTKSVNQLCLECHGPESEPKKVENEPLVTIFGGAVKLPENYFRQVPVLPLRYGIGHPTERHPVTDVTNAQTKAVTHIDCLTCHQPHASAKPDLLAKDQANNMDFCKTCHANGLNLSDTSGGKAK